MASLKEHANLNFDASVRTIMAAARERTPSAILPPRYILTVTEEIGQDRANDVSHIATVRERPRHPVAIQPLAEDQRIFHEHALALASAYAVAEGLNAVMWQKNRRYAWI